MKTKEMAERVAKFQPISGCCPHCSNRALFTPDYVRGGEGRLDWECSVCRSGATAKMIEEATARVFGERVTVPRRVTELPA